MSKKPLTARLFNVGRNKWCGTVTVPHDEDLVAVVISTALKHLQSKCVTWSFCAETKIGEIYAGGRTVGYFVAPRGVK